MSISTIPQGNLSRFFFADTRFSFVWLIVRMWLGYEWLMAGIEKFQNPAWIGEKGGVAVTGFLNGALAKVGVGAHPDVFNWYGYFIEHFALPNAEAFSYAVTFGEIAVGLALILGFFTGFSAFWGVFMNFNFLLAGTVSINPVMVLAGIFLMLSWRTAGYYGLDRFLLPAVNPRSRTEIYP